MRDDAPYRNSCTANRLAIGQVLHNVDHTQKGGIGFYLYSVTCDMQRYVLVLTILDSLIMVVSAGELQPVKEDATERVEHRNSHT